MPYYLYKISTPDDLGLVKHLDLLHVFDGFKAARTEAKKLRAEQPLQDAVYKVMFAESQLAAEEALLEKREKPVLMEHER